MSEISEIAKRIMELQPPIYGAFSPYSFAAAKHAAATLAAAHESALVRERDEANWRAKFYLEVGANAEKAAAKAEKELEQARAMVGELAANIAELEADNKRLVTAATKAIANDGGKIIRMFNGQTGSERTCCCVPSYEPHASDCWVPALRAVLSTTAARALETEANAEAAETIRKMNAEIDAAKGGAM